MTEPDARKGLRTDIQALRAVAVSLVLVYHLVPDRLTGGFVGVDSFFVISGFLITLHLLERPPRGGRDLLGFWGRRIRRLLPASLLVLAVTLVASRAVAPETQWENTARQTAAATLYVVNWVLAGDSVDYLAAENDPSPVQHFWSLSVEEQFYLGWPLLLVLLAWLGSRVRARRAVVGTGLAVVVAASFAWSVLLTRAEPAAAYFVTPTRIWELGAGGLLAFGMLGGRRLPVGPAVRTLLAAAGLGLLVAAAVGYTSATPFPGWQAALPVVGTALVIAAETPEGSVLGRLLAVRPVQWLGDVSYAVYLWHWPIIVLLPYVSGGSLGVLDGLVVLVGTLVLAGLTKTFVEDPFRTARWNARLGRTFLVGAGGMTLVLGLVGVQLAEVDRRLDRDRERLALALSGADACFGAGALDPAQDCAPWEGDPVPAPALAAKDKSEAYRSVSGGRDCFSYLPGFRDVRCTFGERAGDVRVALVGNSHAGHWLPPVQRIAEERGWRVDTYLASQCALAEVRQTFRTRAHATACRGWVRRTVSDLVAGRPDLVVISNRISVPVEGRSLDASLPLYGAAYDAVLEELTDASLPVVVLRDTPTPGDAGVAAVPDCLAEESDISRCGGTRADWVPDDPMVDAVAALEVDRVRLVDLTDRICGPTRCEAVVGGAVAYFDASHLTATFARTLAPYLEPELLDALRP